MNFQFPAHIAHAEVELQRFRFLGQLKFHLTTGHVHLFRGFTGNKIAQVSRQLTPISRHILWGGILGRIACSFQQRGHGGQLALHLPVLNLGAQVHFCATQARLRGIRHNAGKGAGKVSIKGVDGFVPVGGCLVRPLPQVTQLQPERPLHITESLAFFFILGQGRLQPGQLAIQIRRQLVIAGSLRLFDLALEMGDDRTQQARHAIQRESPVQIFLFRFA